MKREVLLGFRVGDAEPVNIPVRHMCIAGQTQEAGKTTALEGLIERSGLAAVTFITKRGEGSFLSARRINPYFREQADWQFVASLLEASRGEKLKFERAWIIRASEGAKSLADVQKNVRRAMKTAKGLSADVYLTLNAYLDVVVPSIAAVKWAKHVELAASGVSAMDLTALSPEMQHLVIKSTLDWVLQHSEDTIVIVPEAWKFIPQGRGTPVKLSAEAFIRQAAGLKNYLWLDSQDIGGIEKTILRSVAVWVLGVQREANEIKRTLDNLPASTPQLKAGDIASLELGQFYACWQRHAIKTYAQPVWVDEWEAKAVAKGVQYPPTRPPALTPAQDRDRFMEIATAEGADLGVARVVAEAQITSGDDDMTPAQERKMDALLDGMKAVLSNLGAVERNSPDDPELRAPPSSEQRAGVLDKVLDGDTEALYQSFKARLVGEILEDPKILALLATRPELQVTVKKEVISVDESTLPGKLAKLLYEGFFRTPRRSGEVTVELKARGESEAVKINLGRALQKLNEQGFLRRDGDTSGTTYVEVPDMIVNVKSA